MKEPEEMFEPDLNFEGSFICMGCGRAAEVKPEISGKDVQLLIFCTDCSFEVVQELGVIDMGSAVTRFDGED